MAIDISGIELAKGWKGSFASFKKELGHVEYFKKQKAEDREQVMMDTYERLTGKKAAQKKNRKRKSDGELSSGQNSSGKTESTESK